MRKEYDLRSLKVKRRGPLAQTQETSRGAPRNNAVKSVPATVPAGRAKRPVR
jgi:hypothetical protein